MIHHPLYPRYIQPRLLKAQTDSPVVLVYGHRASAAIAPWLAQWATLPDKDGVEVDMVLELRWPTPGRDRGKSIGNGNTG